MAKMTEAQARAVCWSILHRRPIEIQCARDDGRDLYIDPTNRALIGRGWIVPDGTPPRCAINSSIMCQQHVVTAKGYMALASYFGRVAATMALAETDSKEPKQ